MRLSAKNCKGLRNISQIATSSVLAVVAVGMSAGCGTLRSGDGGPRQSVRLTASRAAHHSYNLRLNLEARSFMQKVPKGDTGYPGLRLILAPSPASTIADPGKVNEVIQLFDRLPVARAILGERLRSRPEITYSFITDYSSSIHGIKQGSTFPGIALTYYNTACESYGPPNYRGPRIFKCTTVAFFDLKNSRWLTIYQYTRGSLSAITKS
jgi:hypothetical protein